MKSLMVAGLVCLAVVGCAPKGPDKVDEEALDAIVAAVQDQLNEPPASIYAVLREAAQAPQVGWDRLVIDAEGRPEPINWWLLNRGYLDLSGAQFAARPVFTLTKSARDLLAEPDQPWFEAVASGEPVVDCATAAAVAVNGCEVSVEVTPTLTPVGKSVIGDAKLLPLSVTAAVALGLEDWEVFDLTAAGSSPRQIALVAILGPEQTRDAQAAVAAKQLIGTMRSLAGESDPIVSHDAWTPPNYVEPPAPVTSRRPDSPTGRPSSPFRPGA